MSDLILPSILFKKELHKDGDVLSSFKKKKLYLDKKYIDEKTNIKFITPLMVPGNIYTFEYSPSNKNLKIFDRQPIIYSLGQVKNDRGVLVELGINFNLIPIRYKAEILDRLFKATSSLQTQFISKSKIGYFPINKDICNKILQNTGYSHALWRWVPGRINNKIVLDYSDWYVTLHMLPYKLIGMNMSQIESDYLNHLKN